MRTACRELQGCASFSKLLQAVLELGNHLNQVGAAWGLGHDRAMRKGAGAWRTWRKCMLHLRPGSATSWNGCACTANPVEHCLCSCLPPALASVQGTQRGAAAGFKLDTLLKLADVKGTDRKTSLLHFVITQAGFRYLPGLGRFKRHRLTACGCIAQLSSLRFSADACTGAAATQRLCKAFVVCIVPAAAGGGRRGHEGHER